MARKKNYFAKSNKGKAGAVFLNNVVAAHQKQQRENQKAAESAKRRAAAEAERERKRLARAAEKARRQAERVAEQQRKQREKLEAKESAVAERLKLEFDKAGLFTSSSVIADISRKAVKASVTPAKAKSFFLDGKEDEIAESCAEEFLVSEGVGLECQDLDDYKPLCNFVAQCRPQQKAVDYEAYQKLKARVDFQIEARLEMERRSAEREELISELLKTKVMFKDEIEDFAEIIESQDLAVSDIVKSQEYKNRIENKRKYVQEVKNQITPIKLHH